MTTFDPAVRDLLDSLVPDFAGREGDWDAVVREAHRHRRVFSRPPRRWTVAVALGLVALAIGLLATPALGLGSRLLDLFGFSAPPAIKNQIAELSAPSPGVIKWLGDQQGFGIRASETRGLFKIQTSKGPIWLWAAPTKAGGVCRFVQMPPLPATFGTTAHDRLLPRGPLACTGAASRYSRLDGALETPKNWPQLDRPLLHGHVYPPVVSVRLDYTDGTHEQLPLRDGFFLQLIPPGKQPLDLIARNATGKAVAREPLATKPPAGPPPMHRLFRVATPYGTAIFLVTTPDDPHHCYGVEIDGNSTSGCGTPMQGPISYSFQQQGQAPNAIALLYGQAKPDVTSLEIKLATGKTLIIPLHDRFFLYPLRPSQRPLYLIAHTTKASLKVPVH
jgi:hypothetical protein